MNLLALLLVLGLCWAAMMWLGGRSHGQSRTSHRFEYEYIDGHGSLRAVDGYAPQSQLEACSVCEGVGAQQTRGKLAPCPKCLGTGVLSQA